MTQTGEDKNDNYELYVHWTFQFSEGNEIIVDLDDF